MPINGADSVGLSTEAGNAEFGNGNACFRVHEITCDVG